jgi:hypothetical protein
MSFDAWHVGQPKLSRQTEVVDTPLMADVKSLLQTPYCAPQAPEPSLICADDECVVARMAMNIIAAYRASLGNRLVIVAFLSSRNFGAL